MEAKACPTCGGTQWIPVSYGKPGPEAMAASERGELALGGCIVEPGQPREVCARCYARANSPTLYVLTGLPGAGKSTRAAALIRDTNAAHVDMDTELRRMGISIVDYERRAEVQPQIEALIAPPLADGRSVVAEFGSWTREERARIRELATASGARTELHWLDAPVDVCIERVLARGGEGAEVLATAILRDYAHMYERPTPEEGAEFDAYVPPGAAGDS